MTNAELLAKIKAEIDKLYGEYKNKFHQCGDQYHLGLIDGLDMAERVLDTLESEKPINPDEAMKKLDEKIAIVKQRKTWDGVDVDKYMDEVRGREPEKPMDLEEEVKRYYSDNFAYISSDQPTLSILTNIARHFTDWQKEQMMKEAVEGIVTTRSMAGNIVTAHVDYHYKDGQKVRIVIIND